MPRDSEVDLIINAIWLISNLFGSYLFVYFFLYKNMSLPG